MATGTEIERLLVRLVGDATQYQKMLRDAQNQTKKAAASIRSQMSRISRSVSNMGRSLSLRLTAPIAAIGGLAVRSFAKFDQAMTESTSIMKVTEEQVVKMRKMALSLSTQGVQGPADLAKSYFFLASAGLDAEQSMAALPGLMKFATAGAFDMSLATDLLTDAQSALGMTVKDNAEQNAANMQRLADVLVKANTLANASVQQFSEALTNTAAASLKTYGKSVEEGVAVLAAYADQGVKANIAGTNLSRVMLLLSKSALDEADAHKRLGFEVFDANGKMRNFADIIGNLEDITRGMSDEARSATLAELGFAARVQQSILPLLGSSDAIREYEKELHNAGGTVDEVANKQMKSFSNQLTRVKNQLSVAGIEIGQILAPAIGKVAEFLKSAISVWQGFSDGTKKTIVMVAALVAGIGPLLTVLGAIIGPLGVATAAIVAIGAAIGATFDFTNPSSAIQEFVDKFKSTFVDRIRDGVALAKFTFKNWKTLVALQVEKAILAVMTFVNDMHFSFTQTLPAIVKILPSAFAEAFRVIIANAENFYNALVSAIKGKGFDFAFEGMSDAFIKQLADIPILADRKLTENEKIQKQVIGAMEDQLAKNMAKEMKAVRDLGKPKKVKVKDAVETAQAVVPNKPPPGTAPPPKEAKVKKIAEVREAVKASSLEGRKRLAEYRARIGPKSEPVKQTALLGSIDVKLGELVGLQRNQETGETMVPANLHAGATA